MAPIAVHHDSVVRAELMWEEGWPAIETSACGRVGFWRERTPAVFGRRRGVGPLIITPDTNILITLRDELSEIEDGAGLIVRPNWTSGHEATPIDALHDLVQLWWWRDVRFLMLNEHLSDARRPLTEERRAIREAAVDQFGQDFVERGGYEIWIEDDVAVEDAPCALHAIPSTRPDPGKVKWPKDPLDRILVQAAFDGGCHVFLTTDKGILRCHESLFASGMAVVRPGQLLKALNDAGELAECGSAFPVPDLSALSRLYGAFAHDG